MNATNMELLSEDVIITNVKKLTIEEVKEFIKKNE